MPFPMKVQPIDSYALPDHEPTQFEPVKPMVKSRLKRLFERQFTNVLRISVTEKAAAGVDELHSNKECLTSSGEFEPSSLCLSKMVRSFMEDTNEKQLSSVKYGKIRCNCFNGNSNDTFEDELDLFGGYGDSNFCTSGDACEILKGLVPCASVRERNLLADTARIVEKNKICKRKDDICRAIVTDGLLALGYDASICKSRWEKSPLHPAGDYEYIDVMVEGDRLLVDIDFKSEFEIARPTKTYKTILQNLPYIFIGKSDRLQKIISVVAEAAKQSLKKKGMHVPPWRKVEYVKAKWLSSYTRTTKPISSSNFTSISVAEKMQPLAQTNEFVPSQIVNSGDDDTELGESLFEMSDSSGEDEKTMADKDWKPPELKPKRSLTGLKMVTGLASVMDDD